MVALINVIDNKERRGTLNHGIYLFREFVNSIDYIGMLQFLLIQDYTLLFLLIYLPPFSHLSRPRPL
jgi:hypothetical protein